MNGYGVVLVTYNSATAIGTALDALAAADPADILVVDNGSTDRTLEEVRKRPDVRLIANPWNRGFAAAANQAFENVHCDCILLLNPDATPAGPLNELADACAQAGVAAAGGKLIGSDGRAQAGFMVRRLPTPWTLAFEALGINRIWSGNPVNRRYRCRGFDPECAAEVEQPAGAFLMLRRQVWRALGGFDDRFFPLWFEDVDFCKRALKAGYRILYVPTASAKHSGGHSIRQLSSANRAGYWYATLLSYAAKHFRPTAVRAVCMGVVLGSLVRAFFSIIRGDNLKAKTAVRVIQLAGRFFISGSRDADLVSVAA